MTVLATDPTTGDLVFTAGDLSVRDGVEEIAQNVRTRLRLFAGEVPARQDLGVPFFTEIGIKGIDTAIVEAIYRQVIEGTPGIVSVDEFEFVGLDSLTRTATIRFSALASVQNLADRIPIHDQVTVTLQGFDT